MKWGASFPFNPDRNMFFHGATFRNTWSPTLNLRGLLLTFAYLFYLSCVVFIRSLMVLTFSVVTWTNSTPYNFMSPISSQHKGVLHLLPYKASYEGILIMAWWLLLYWILPMLCALPSSLQTLTQPLIGLPKLGSLFLIGYRSRGEMQCLYPILFLSRVVCSAKVGR
jgi:hypothetical protein